VRLLAGFRGILVSPVMIFSPRSSLRVARVFCVLFTVAGLRAQGPGDLRK
jgi:hypothetical protein